MQIKQSWLALAIGNSRWHWAWFQGETLIQAWNTSCLLPEELSIALPALTLACANRLECWVASVVPDQTQIWQAYPHSRVITPDRIPLGNRYPTLGIDRALAVWGAIQTGKAPVLVIDGGTALTLTGADGESELVGGAILPGLRLQMRSLAQNTAALPPIEDLSVLPPRWARNTPDAIRSGVLYSVLAGLREFIEAWQYPDSAIVLTGGDAEILLIHLTQVAPDLSDRLTLDPHLIFWGIRSLRSLSG